MPGKKKKFELPELTLVDACALGDLSLVKKLCQDPKYGPAWRGADGTTGLHAACSNGKEDVVGFMIREYQVDVNARTHLGHTPLMCAARNGKLGLVEMLVEAGVDPTMFNDELLTAEDYAQDMGHNGILAYLQGLALKSDDPLGAAAAGDLHALKRYHAADGWMPTEDHVHAVLAFSADGDNVGAYLATFKYMVQLDAALVDAGGGHQKPTPLVRAIEVNHWALFMLLVEGKARADLSLPSVLSNSTSAQAPEQIAKLLNRDAMLTVLYHHQAEDAYAALMAQKPTLDVQEREEWVANLKEAKKEREGTAAEYEKLMQARAAAHAGSAAAS